MNFLFFQQDFASFEMADNEDNNSVVPQRRGQVSHEQEDLVVKGKISKNIHCFLSSPAKGLLECIYNLGRSSMNKLNSLIT